MFDLRRSLAEAPVTALVAFVSIKQAARLPDTIVEGALFDGPKSDKRRGFVARRERDHKTVSSTEEAVFAILKDKTGAGLRLTTEDGIEADVRDEVAHGEVVCGVGLVEQEAVDCPGGLGGENLREDLAEHPVAGGEIGTVLRGCFHIGTGFAMHSGVDAKG